MNGVLFGVRLLGLFEQRRDLGPQPFDFFLHLAMAHRLVPRSVGPHHLAVQGEIAELNHAQFPGDLQNLDEQLRQRVEMDLAKVADGAKVGSLLSDNRQKGHVPLAGGRDLATGKDSDAVGIQQQRGHHRHVEGRCTAGFPIVVGVHPRQIKLRSEVNEEKDQIVFRQDIGGGDGSAGRLIGILLPELRACLHPCGLQIATLPCRRTRPHLTIPPPRNVDRLVAWVSFFLGSLLGPYRL